MNLLSFHFHCLHNQKKPQNFIVVQKWHTNYMKLHVKQKIRKKNTDYIWVSLHLPFTFHKHFTLSPIGWSNIGQ